MNDFKKILKSPYFKITMILLVLVVVVLIVKAVLEMFSKKDSYTREASSQVVSSELSFTNLEYKNMAERLYAAMNGLGTGESIIYNVLSQLQSKSDWLKLVETFGVRKSTLWTSSFEGNLIQWFGSELTGDEMRKVSEILNKIGVLI